MANCYRCRYYYVTWDPARPHGCRGMGFKSRKPPEMIVRRCSEGMDCLMYRPKIRTGSRRFKRTRTGLPEKG